MSETTQASVAADALLGAVRELIAGRPPEEDPHDIARGYVHRFAAPACLPDVIARLVVALLAEREACGEAKELFRAATQHSATLLGERDEARAELDRLRAASTPTPSPEALRAAIADPGSVLPRRHGAETVPAWCARAVIAVMRRERLTAAAVLTPDAPELPAEGLARGGVVRGGTAIVGESGCTLVEDVAALVRMYAPQPDAPEVTE